METQKDGRKEMRREDLRKHAGIEGKETRKEDLIKHTEMGGKKIGRGPGKTD